MNRNIAIVEDEVEEAETLRSYFARYTQEYGTAFTVTHFLTAEAFLNRYRPVYDLVLMDICLPKTSGMDAAALLRRVDQSVPLIFVTNMAQFAVKGYEVDALDYVLKPVSYPAFAKSMSRAMGRLRRRKSRYVSIGGKNGAQRVDCARIYYIEADGHSLSYHTADGRLSGTGTMKELEAALADSWFFRCGKGVLVNLEHVSAIVEGDAVVHGETVQVSRARRKEFLAAFNRYINEVGQ